MPCVAKIKHLTQTKGKIHSRERLHFAQKEEDLHSCPKGSDAAMILIQF